VTNGEKTTCAHCRDTKYVFVYWLEKGLEQHNIHMTDIPPEIFTKFPLEFLVYCHCNIFLAFRTKPSYIEQEATLCRECNGSTWRFSEVAEEAGYRWKKVRDLSWADIKHLPCHFFKRCPCGEDEQAPKSPQRTESLRDVLSLIRIPLQRPSFELS